MSNPPNGTLRPVLLGLLMAVGGLLPASLLGIDNPTLRAIVILGACIMFLLIGVFLPQPKLPDSMSDRHKIKPKDDEDTLP